MTVISIAVTLIGFGDVMNNFGDCIASIKFSKSICGIKIFLKSIIVIFLYLFYRIKSVDVAYIHVIIILGYLVIPWLIINIIVLSVDYIKMLRSSTINFYAEGIVFDDFICEYKNFSFKEEKFPLGNTIIFYTDFKQRKFNYYLSRKEANYFLKILRDIEYKNKVNKTSSLGKLETVIKQSKLKAGLELLINIVFTTCFIVMISVAFTDLRKLILVIFISLFMVFLYGYKSIVYTINFLDVVLDNKSIQLYEHGLKIDDFICLYNDLIIDVNSGFSFEHLTIKTNIESITVNNYYKNTDYDLLLSNTISINVYKKSFIHYFVKTVFVIIACVAVFFLTSIIASFLLSIF